MVLVLNFVFKRWYKVKSDPYSKLSKEIDNFYSRQAINRDDEETGF